MKCWAIGHEYDRNQFLPGWNSLSDDYYSFKGKLGLWRIYQDEDGKTVLELSRPGTWVVDWLARDAELAMEIAASMELEGKLWD